MKNVRIAFEEFDGSEDQIPPGYQRITCHMTVDIKMGGGGTFVEKRDWLLMVIKLKFQAQ